jgi:hypothetical protein
MPGCSDTLAELCLPQLARSLLIGTCLSGSLPSVMHLVRPGFFLQASTPLFAFRLLQDAARMALNRRTYALFVRHARTQILLKLKCKTNKSKHTTAMPSYLRRIVCPTGAFHPTCCSNESIARGLETATGSIRSIISRVKSRRCSTRRSGHADGSTRAVNDDAAVRNTRRI